MSSNVPVRNPYARKGKPPFNPPNFLGEVWRHIEGFEGVYAISNMGRVKTLITRKGSRAGTLLKPGINGRGYPQVILHYNGVKKNARLHCLVADAFLGPRPDNYDINHMDGNKKNPRSDNLEYVTKEGNTQHAIEHGLFPNRKGEANSAAKLTASEVQSIRALRGSMSRKGLAKRFNVSVSAIDGIVDGKTWLHVK